MGKQSRYDEIANEMKNMLVKVGWKKDFIEKNTPVLPISGWMGDNLLKKSTNMDWWKGMDVEYGKEIIHCDTFYELSTSSAAYQNAQPVLPCACRSQGSTRSRGWVMSWLAEWSRVSSSRARKWSSCRRTQLPTLALVRSSQLRCTTPVLTSP